MNTIEMPLTAEVQQWIESLNATEIAPGFYGWLLPFTTVWRIVSVDAIKKAIEIYHTPPAEGYKRVFTAGLKMIDMPSWWTPEQRFAWRKVGYRPGTGPLRVDNRKHGDGWYRVSASLSTGKEISA